MGNELMNKRKGIILAGGTGSRLLPMTTSVSKQLLPVYDKPMIYYPLTVLMLSGIQEIAIITNPQHMNQFKCLLGDGAQWGLEFSYIAQPSPDGLAQAFLLAEDFLDGDSSALILGDNIFYGNGLRNILFNAMSQLQGGTVFGYEVANPQRYGVIGFHSNGVVSSVEEKPISPKSNCAVTGLYFFDETASQKAKNIKASPRGELEITSLIEQYLDEGSLSVQKIGRGYAWLDMGTHKSFLEAGNFVHLLQKRQGLQIGCPEEIAYENSWISLSQLEDAAKRLETSEYGEYLQKLVFSSS
jgi:glucose-1-phosphate thymidylyltransferase